MGAESGEGGEEDMDDYQQSQFQILVFMGFFYQCSVPVVPLDALFLCFVVS